MPKGMNAERIAVLTEVRTLAEQRRKDWEHLDPAEQSLRALRDEIDELIKTAEYARRNY